MDNTFIFIRHAHTQIDSKVPVSKWNLSTKGKFQSEMITKKPQFLKADVLISSDEKKAIDTLKPLARKLKKGTSSYRELNELFRDRGGFLSKESFSFVRKYAFKNPDKSKNHWELASNALSRFSEKIEEIDMAYENRTIIVVAHGIVLNLYFANLQGIMHEAYERSQKNTFCSYGFVKNKKVVRDLH
jgi:broad specificity phosphatase PhoE